MRARLLVVLAACSGPATSHGRQAIDTQISFAHAGFGAGPILYTNASGHLLEERRYEPFGAPIDASSAALDLNELNKRTDPSTGWSDHGARWLAPETARWLGADPPVRGPSAKFMLKPWALHPYQYVDQNPLAYWDPDGRDSKTMSTSEVDAVSLDMVQHAVTDAATAPPDMKVYGNRSTGAEGLATGPYTHLTIEPYGGSAGFGITNGPYLGPNGPTGAVSLVRVDAGIGQWTDASGTKNYGVDVQADGFKFQINPGDGLGPVGFDFGGGNVDYGVYGTKSSFTVGGQANLIDGAVTIANDHSSTRLGLSLGVGLAGRVHYDNGQYGFGFDFGPVEFDAKTDKPYLLPLALPFGGFGVLASMLF